MKYELNNLMRGCCQPSPSPSWSCHLMVLTGNYTSLSHPSLLCAFPFPSSFVYPSFSPWSFPLRLPTSLPIPFVSIFLFILSFVSLILLSFLPYSIDFAYLPSSVSCSLFPSPPSLSSCYLLPFSPLPLYPHFVSTSPSLPSPLHPPFLKNNYTFGASEYFMM